MKVFEPSIRWILVLMAMALFSSCSHLPVINHVDPAAAPDTKERCLRPFLDVPYRFIHSLEVSFPGGRTGTLLGVTVVYPAEKTIHSVIMTIEGFLLFDARYDKEVRVNRAVPPFNAEQFAGHMMEDVRLMFLAPEGKLVDAGVYTDGSSVCRYYGNKDTIVDVSIHKDESWEIKAYSSSHDLLRKIRAFDVQTGIPGMVELSGFGFREYSLRLNLISAEAVSPEANHMRPAKTPEDDE